MPKRRAIMVMFDSLNRHMLPPYECDWTYAPNFKRLAEKTVVFDNCYVGPIKDEQLGKRMLGHLVRLMKENDAPEEQFERLELHLV